MAIEQDRALGGGDGAGASADSVGWERMARMLQRMQMGGGGGGLVRAAVDPVAVEDVGNGLDITAAMAGEAEHTQEEEEVEELQVRPGDRPVR